MAISYKKLWKLFIDKDMKKKDLQRCMREFWKDRHESELWNEMH